MQMETDQYFFFVIKGEDFTNLSEQVLSDKLASGFIF